MNRTPISNPFDEDEKSGRRPVFWAILGLGMACIVGLLAAMAVYYKPDPQELIDKYFATSTSTATQTPTQTATPTPDVLLTAVSQAEPIFKDAFDSNQNNWESQFSNNSVYIANGLLNLRSNQDGYVGISLCLSCPSSGNNFYFQASVSVRKDTPERFGLVFCLYRYGTRYYTFSISQKYDVFDFFKHSSQGWETIVRNRSTISIKEFPNTNTLGAFFNEGEIKLYINNDLVYSYKDETPLSCSRLGFFVDGGEFDMQGDDVVIYKNPAPPTPAP